MENFWAVLLPSLFTFAGTLVGIMASSKLTVYRIEQLEKKVDKHNSVIEKTFKLQETAAVLEEKIKVADHRLDDLERKVG